MESLSGLTGLYDGRYMHSIAITRLTCNNLTVAVCVPDGCIYATPTMADSET